jgi:hypothetical protein
MRHQVLERSFMSSRIIQLAVFALVLAFGHLPSGGADLGSFPVDPVFTDEATVSSYLSRRAVIYEIRRSFDVITEEEMTDALRGDASSALASGVTKEALAQTEDDLLAEGGYFIVSLRYLVISGFPAWPEDRPASTYKLDSLAILGPLLRQFRSSIDEGSDGAGVLSSAAQVYWWTEGEREVRGERANFDNIDARVSNAIENAKSHIDASVQGLKSNV